MPVIENIFASEELAKRYAEAKKQRPELTYAQWHNEESKKGEGARFGGGQRFGKES